MSRPQPEPVSVEYAFRAAVAQSARLTEALIMAQAYGLEQSGRLERLERENTELRTEVGDLRADLREARRSDPDVPPDPVPAPERVVLADGSRVACWHTQPGSPCDWNVCRQKGVRFSGETVEYPAAAVGEAVSPHPFSD
jgi:hypothetical protein